MLTDTYEESKENSFRGMIGDFYNRKNTSIVILVWIYSLSCIALAVYCGIAFFNAEDMRTQIMYATIFVVLMQSLQAGKFFAWLVMHRNSIKREIKRLELRIAELSEAIREHSK